MNLYEALCATHAKEFAAAIKRAARARVSAPSCPACWVAAPLAAAVERERSDRVHGDLRLAREEIERLKQRLERAEEEAQRMSEVVAAQTACAHGALRAGRDHHEPTLRTLAEGGYAAVKAAGATPSAAPAPPL